MIKQVNINGTWCDVPDKAKYVAQDKDGAWFWYVMKPKLGGVFWGGPITDYGHIVQEPTDNWKEELYELVDVE